MYVSLPNVHSHAVMFVTLFFILYVIHLSIFYFVAGDTSADDIFFVKVWLIYHVDKVCLVKYSILSRLADESIHFLQ